MFELWDLSDALYAFSIISVRSEMDSPARSVRWCQTLHAPLVGVNAAIGIRYCGSKIKPLRLGYFGAAFLPG